MATNATPTRALSIAEPWAYLIAAGFKQIENRTWRTDYRGTIAVHASKATRNCFDEQLIYEVCDLHPAIFKALDDERIDEGHQILHLGAIIGTVDIIDCVDYNGSIDADEVFDRFNYLTADGPAPELPVGAWAEGPHCFVLANPRRFARPIACAGKLSLWSLSPDLQRAVAEAGRFVLTDPGQPSKPPAALPTAGEVAAKPTTPADRKAERKAEQRRETEKAKRRQKLLGQKTPRR
jgi:hypothetical protein